MTDPDPRPVLSPEDAGLLLGMTRYQVVRLMQAGQLRHVNNRRRGGRDFYKTSELWVEEFKAGGPRRGQTVGRDALTGVNRGKRCVVIGLEYAKRLHAV